MGVVYKARQRSLNRLVALKLILGGQHASAEHLTRFRQKAEAAAQLRHPGIVQVYEVRDHQGQPYFSMEYVPGRTLADAAKTGPMAPRDAARHVRAAAEAIHHAHDRGFLQRDLKPSSLLVGEDGRPRRR